MLPPSELKDYRGFCRQAVYCRQPMRMAKFLLTSGKNPGIMRSNICNINLDFPLIGIIFTDMPNQTIPIEEPAPNAKVYVNEDCWFVNEEGRVTVFVKWLELLSYDDTDTTTKRIVIVILAESKVATQEELARAFAVDRATIFRWRMNYRKRGVEAFTPKKKGPKAPRKTGGKVDKTILKLKKKGESNREVARKVGVDEGTIRSTLKRLGYKKDQGQKDLPLSRREEEGKEEEACAPCKEVSSSGPCEPRAIEVSDEDFPVEQSFDPDPSSRDIDRMLARMGFLEDAAPMFQNATAVKGIGVLLAVPVLVLHGVFSDCKSVFSILGAAFYGLRNTVLSLVFCFLRGINRPENLKEHSPPEMGKAMGLDRAPEMKTLRRKIRQLAEQNRVVAFIKKQLERHLLRLKSNLLWVYVDGHLSVYSGKRKLTKHHVTRLRISLPSVLDYWINDEKADPLLVMTGRPRKGIVKVIEEAIGQLRAAGEKRVITFVFDREGWSPDFFARLEEMEGIRFLTYRKTKSNRKLPRLPEEEFARHRWEFDGQKVEYDLADKDVYIDYRVRGKKKRIVVRQISRRTEDGHQTHIVTNDRESSPVEIAYRMFSRWSQENFLKYMRHEKDLDGLVTYLMEDADAKRLVPNPYRKELKEDIGKKRAELEKLMSRYGQLALENEEASRPTMRGFKIANGEIGLEIRKKKEAIEKLEATLKRLSAKVPVRLAIGQKPKKVHTQTRLLIHAFRMVSHRAETALRELIRDSYPRWRGEGRTLIRTFLNASGDIEIRDGRLFVTLYEQASPHRTKVLASLCEALNLQKARFPGSDLVLHFEVRGAENVA